jgi:hypothetical protein
MGELTHVMAGERVVCGVGTACYGESALMIRSINALSFEVYYTFLPDAYN